MASRPSPPMLRRQLGAEMRRLREQTGRTCADVAGELSWSESKLSRIETAHTGISNRDLDRLLLIYELPEPSRDRLRAMAAKSRQRAWWEAYGDVLPNAYETYIGFEAEAAEILSYEAMVVPGLLQTDEYARAVIDADDSWNDPDIAAQRVAVRMARQSVLTRQPPPELRLVLDEAVVRRQIGGSEVIRRQLRYLVDLSQRENITLQILPLAVTVHAGLNGSFVILRFPADEDQSLVYCEGLTGGVFRTKPEELRSYQSNFEALCESSLTPNESADFLAEVARE
jgi:transcriptional regulator with XRE-family HTH domain